jgi:hypothetical protein
VPPPPLRLARRGRLLAGVAVGRLGGDLVDVREDRLAEVVEHFRREPGPAAGLHEPPPCEPRADAVGGQQRVEAAAGVVLPAAQVDVDRAGGADVRGRVLDELEEALEGDLDPAPDLDAERAFHSARIIRDLGGDRGDHLVGEPGEHGPQGGSGLRGDRRERARGRRHCGEATKPAGRAGSRPVTSAWGLPYRPAGGAVVIPMG